MWGPHSLPVIRRGSATRGSVDDGVEDREDPCHLDGERLERSQTAHVARVQHLGCLALVFWGEAFDELDGPVVLAGEFV